MHFYEKVYEIVRRIPVGSVTTYGLIARELNHPRAAQAVGWALRIAPADVPAHRVVRKDGKLAHPGVFGGEDIQRTWLQQEGITFAEDGRINMYVHVWDGL